MITCREVIDFLMAYCDHELPAEQRAAFERHLHCCPPCVEYMKSYEETVRLGKKVCQEEEKNACAPPEQLIKAILAARGAK